MRADFLIVKGENAVAPWDVRLDERAELVLLDMMRGGRNETSLEYEIWGWGRCVEGERSVQWMEHEEGTGAGVGVMGERLC